MAHPLRSDPSSLPARDKGNGYGVGRAILGALLLAAVGTVPAVLRDHPRAGLAPVHACPPVGRGF